MIYHQLVSFGDISQLNFLLSELGKKNSKRVENPCYDAHFDLFGVKQTFVFDNRIVVEFELGSEVIGPMLDALCAYKENGYDILF